MHFSFFIFSRFWVKKNETFYLNISLILKGMTIKVTDSAIKLMLSALSDEEEPFNAEIAETATRVTSCLDNVLLSASAQSLDAPSLAKVLIIVANRKQSQREVWGGGGGGGGSSDKINFRRQNIECSSGLQITVGHRTLADQNLPVSFTSVWYVLYFTRYKFQPFFEMSDQNFVVSDQHGAVLVRF